MIVEVPFFLLFFRWVLMAERRRFSPTATSAAAPVKARILLSFFSLGISSYCFLFFFVLVGRREEKEGWVANWRWRICKGNPRGTLRNGCDWLGDFSTVTVAFVGFYLGLGFHGAGEISSARPNIWNSYHLR